MSNRIKNNLKNLVGQTLNQYYSKVKPTISDLRYKQEYQNRIIDCMIGEVDDNYIETPEIDAAVVKLEYSKEGLVKIPTIKGKTILVDEDGNETDTPREGYRLVSVGEEEDNKLIILSKNKNLIDKMKIGDIQQETGSLTSDRIGVISGYIKVKPNTNYTLSEQLTATSDWYAIFEYDENKQLLNYHYNKIMLTSSKTHYVAFKYHNADNISGKFQFEEGNVVTPITEPKQHKTEIFLSEPLRSLPNGVCDEIVGNKLIRRVGKVTLTGEEGWWSNWTNVSFFEWFSNLRITNWKPISDNITWFSNKLKSTTSYSIEHQGQFNCFCFGVDWDTTNPKVIVRPSYDIVEEGNVDQFKEWLKKNNMIILYELEEPIIEELPNGITLQGFDDTTMYIENEITPTVQYGYNALIPYKEELLNQKEEVETNTLDIENNIIPYLMDMEFNLMLMEDK